MHKDGRKDRWSQLYFKREDLNHTGAHKINNTIGQVLLAKRTGKKSYSGNGSRATWVAAATVAARSSMNVLFT